MEAFRVRGAGDFFASHDLEDFIAVVDGRESLLEEVQVAPADLAAYLSEAVTELLAAPRFRDALPGYMPGDAIGQQRVTVVIDRLLRMSMSEDVRQ